MKTLKNLVTLLVTLVSVQAFATSLHPDTYVKPLVKIKFPIEDRSYYFEVRDHGSVRYQVDDYSDAQSGIGIMPVESVKEHLFLSHAQTKKINEIARKLRFATTTTTRAEITCMAMPTPLYTSFLSVREESRDEENYITLEHKIGPCARTTTSMSRESDNKLKANLIKILMKAVEDNKQ